MSERSKQNYNDYYDINDPIGNGSYGFVYKGKEKISNEPRAIKIIDLNRIREDLSYEYETNEEINKELQLCINRFINEFENMKICSNNNSVKCYEYFINDE